MQGFIKTEFSSTLSDDLEPGTVSLYQSLSKETFASGQPPHSASFPPLMCRKKLEFDAVATPTRLKSTPKKNTAIVAGTVQASKHFDNSYIASDSKLRNNNNSQYLKVPSNTKRNARERKRVRTINDYFAKLQKYLPHSKPALSAVAASSASKKLSKVETLKAAIDYIEYLITFAPPTPSHAYNNTNNIATSHGASPSSIMSTTSPASSLLSSPSSSYGSSSSSSSSSSSLSSCDKLKLNMKSPASSSTTSSPVAKVHTDYEYASPNATVATTGYHMASNASQATEYNYATYNSGSMEAASGHVRDATSTYASAYHHHQGGYHSSPGFAQYDIVANGSRMCADMHVYAADAPLSQRHVNPGLGSVSPLAHSQFVDHQNAQHSTHSHAQTMPNAYINYNSVYYAN